MRKTIIIIALFCMTAIITIRPTTASAKIEDQYQEVTCTFAADVDATTYDDTARLQQGHSTNPAAQDKSAWPLGFLVVIGLLMPAASIAIGAWFYSNDIRPKDSTNH